LSSSRRADRRTALVVVLSRRRPAASRRRATSARAPHCAKAPPPPPSKTRAPPPRWRVGEDLPRCTLAQPSAPPPSPPRSSSGFRSSPLLLRSPSAPLLTPRFRAPPPRQRGRWLHAQRADGGGSAARCRTEGACLAALAPRPPARRTAPRPRPHRPRRLGHLPHAIAWGRIWMRCACLGIAPPRRSSPALLRSSPAHSARTPRAPRSSPAPAGEVAARAACRRRGPVLLPSHHVRPRGRRPRPHRPRRLGHLPHAIAWGRILDVRSRPCPFRPRAALRQGPAPIALEDSGTSPTLARGGGSFQVFARATAVTRRSGPVP
jgi:hypothetical protein